MSTTPLVVNCRERDPGDPPDAGDASKNPDGSTGVTTEKATNEGVIQPTTGRPKIRSFKEKLLSNKEMEVNIPDENEELVENKWYKYEQEEEKIANREYVYDPCPEIKVSDTELEKWSEPWKETLVVSLLGKKVSFKMLENKLKHEWARKGKLHITDMPKKIFVVQFTSTDDYKHALMEGPWMLADHYLLVQRWRPFFLINATVERKVAIWVRIPELPLELYNDKFLWRVGSKLGTLLKIDNLTSIQSRGQFARICVEIDLTKKLIPSILVRGVVLKLEYEGLHVVCFACGRYGHKQDSCPEIHSPTLEELKSNEGGGEIAIIGGSLEGNPSTEKSLEQGSEGSLSTGSLRIEEKRTFGQAESDRFPWLTVKKVDRYKIAYKKAKVIEEAQESKSDMIGKDVPKAKDTGSRFELLNEGPVNMLLEELNVPNETLAQVENVAIAEAGPKVSPLGPKRGGPSHRVRNAKGGGGILRDIVKEKRIELVIRPWGPKRNSFPPSTRDRL